MRSEKAGLFIIHCYELRAGRCGKCLSPVWYNTNTPLGCRRVLFSAMNSSRCYRYRPTTRSTILRNAAVITTSLALRPYGTQLSSQPPFISNKLKLARNNQINSVDPF
eukprot:scaffold42062_cov176-Amphora_coffeaeformis.AAC.1